MIVIKSKSEIEIMREAGRISKAALLLGGANVKPGVSTRHLDRLMFDYIKSQGADPSFLNYGGFPATACISINNEVIHGIPGGRIIEEGDIVSIDVGAQYKGYHGDNAATFPAGKISDEAQKLIDVTREGLNRGIAQAVVGNRVGDIGHAVQTYVEENGFAVVRDFVGHGVGSQLHEEPEVPNFGKPGRGPRLVPGMVIAIEPMVNLKGAGVKVLDDGWTTVTLSGSISAHFENTILITDNGPVILTKA